MESSQAILALDIATSIGWALSVGNTVHSSGAFDLSKNNGNDPGKRLLRFRRNFLDKFEFVDRIVIEKVAAFGSFSQSQAQVSRYNEVRAMVYLFCAEAMVDRRKSISISEYHISTWKKIFTGSGKATKEQVGEVLQNHYGWDGALFDAKGKLINNDQADALGILFAHAIDNGRELFFKGA